MDGQRSRRTLGIPDSRSGSYLNLEAELISLRRALTTTSGNLLVRVPLSSENYIPNVQGWNFNLNGNAELNNVVVRGTIEANGVFTGTLGANTVNAININANQVTAGFLNVDRLQVNSINGNRITNNTLDGGKISNGSITAGKIGALEITANQIANLTIDASKIMNLQINSDKIANGAVTNVKIQNIAAEKILAGTISSVGLSNATNITTLGLTVSVNQAQFNAGLVSTSGAFSASISNSGMPSRSAIGSTLNVRIDGNTIVKFTSSARFKKNIADAPLYSLDNVRPRTFRSAIEGDSDQINLGLIAEEAAESGIPGLATVIDGQAESVNHELVGLVLVDHVKDLKRRVEALEDANG